MAQSHAAPRLAPERRFQAFGARHLHSQERPCAYRGGCARDHRHLRAATLPVRLEFSGREIVDAVRGFDRGLPESNRAARRGGHARRIPRHRGKSLSAQMTRRHRPRAGGNSMALEIKVLDYGDIELESSFLVLGRDCGRTRRAPVFGMLILGGTWPILVDTGYRSNQIMETLGMRGLQSHGTMIENQLKNYGLRLRDVRYILHTHLHIDHAGKDDLFPMNTTVVINRRELEYSVSGLMHPQYP